MARYDHLPLWHTALKTAVAIERAVARFPRAHKYGLGANAGRSDTRRGGHGGAGVGAVAASLPDFSVLSSTASSPPHENAPHPNPPADSSDFSFFSSPLGSAQ